MGGFNKVVLGGTVVLAISQLAMWYRLTSDESSSTVEPVSSVAPSSQAPPSTDTEVDALRARVARLERRIGATEAGDEPNDDTVALDARMARVEARLATHRSMLLPDEVGDDDLLALAQDATDPDRALMLFEALHDRAPEGSAARRHAAIGALKSANDLKDGATMRHYAEALSEAELSEAEQQTVATHGAFALEHLGRLEEAVEAHEAVADKWPDQRIAATTYWNLALLMLRADRREEAKRYFDLIVERFGGGGIADDIVQMAKEQRAKLG